MSEWSKVVSGILTDLANIPLGSKDPVPRLTPAPPFSCIHTTMTMKVCKDGPWQKFYPPSRGKGVTGKEWQAALKRKEVAEDKAEKSELASINAEVAAARAEVAFAKADWAAAIALAKAIKLKKAFEKADAKAKKLKMRAELDLARADAM